MCAEARRRTSAARRAASRHGRSRCSTSRTAVRRRRGAASARASLRSRRTARVPSRSGTASPRASEWSRRARPRRAPRAPPATCPTPARRWQPQPHCTAHTRHTHHTTHLTPLRVRVRSYDVIVLARPDLVWYRGVGPHCAHDLTRTTIHRGKPGETRGGLEPLRARGCNAAWPSLQPRVTEPATPCIPAATPRGRGCNPTWPRLQPDALQAGTRGSSGCC